MPLPTLLSFPTTGRIDQEQKVMPRKKASRRPVEEYFRVAIRVERYEIRTEASINHHACHPEVAIELDDREPVYCFASDLTIFGTAVHPEEREGNSYEISICGDDSPSNGISHQLKDLQSRDATGSPKYRKFRGADVPVFMKPPDLALLNKTRGKAHWTARVRVTPRLASDMLVLLTSGQELYLALTETKDERARWVRRVSLQTTDPRSEE